LPNLKLYAAGLPIVFVLDGTIDDSKQLIKEAELGASMLENSPALGRAACWNQAIAALQTDYTLLLSPQITLEAETIAALTAELDANPAAAAAGPKFLDPKGNVAHLGYVFSRGLPRLADIGVPADHPRASRKQSFLGLSDDCLLVRSNQPSFDAELFNSWQDIDWCLRVKECTYVPSAVVRTVGRFPDPPQDDANRGRFIAQQGGLAGLDQLNNAGTYYGSGPNFSCVEEWQRDDAPHLGRIGIFVADYDGCGFVRCILPYRMLVHSGYDLIVSMFAVEAIVDQCDVIVLQRQHSETGLELLQMAHAKGKKVIYEIDDFFHGLHPTNKSITHFQQQPQDLRLIEQLIYQADALTVSTPELAKQYGRFNSNTHIVPNCIDLGLIPQPIKENHSGLVRIGWGGSNSHDADMPLMVEALKRVLREQPQTRLVLMAGDYRHLFTGHEEQLEFYPATFGHEDPIVDYLQVLNEARLDIGLAPIGDTLFNRCKSDYKLVEYGAFGIPAVASDVEPYQLFEKACRTHGKGVLLARSEYDWYRHLTRLVTQAGLRTSMGQAIQAYVWEERGIDKMQAKLTTIVAGLMAGHGHVPQHVEPIHSLNVAWLNNRTAKQAAQHARQRREAQQQLLASAAVA
jgi:glycosyltransferase involved in cell wall biosynthesis